VQNSVTYTTAFFSSSLCERKHTKQQKINIIHTTTIMDTVGPTITPKLVLVTGANGFIASLLIKSLLLEKGYRVCGTIRDISDESKTVSYLSLYDIMTHSHFDT
jgi:hypothetical protein